MVTRVMSVIAVDGDDDRPPPTDERASEADAADDADAAAADADVGDNTSMG